MNPTQAILDLAASRGPRCGSTTVVLIDGPAGSGKTTLAGSVDHEATAAGVRTAVVHMDDLYEGWQGLHAGAAAATQMLSDRAAGASGRYRRYDWHADRYAEWVPLPPCELLVLEGVGSVRTEHLDLASVLVWVEEASEVERLRRGLARDGDQAHEHWREWMQAEQQVFDQVGTRARADLRVDGDGRLL